MMMQQLAGMPRMMVKWAGAFRGCFMVVLGIQCGEVEW